jgi:hypothetical protein
LTHAQEISGMLHKFLAVAVLLTCTGAAMAATDAAKFETELGPTPITHATRDQVIGHGSAVASLTGNRLTIEASFAGLATPATDAHVMMGGGIGMSGDPVFDLTASAATSGTITGALTLTPAQLAALRAGRLYIQVNSQKAPAPGGNLWGWLLPEHPKFGQDEPQPGPWFLPQGEGLKAGRSGRQS